MIISSIIRLQKGFFRTRLEGEVIIAHLTDPELRPAVEALRAGENHNLSAQLKHILQADRRHVMYGTTTQRSGEQYLEMIVIRWSYWLAILMH